MPKDKTENHEKILSAAYDEFLKYGFTDASMRRIADACDMSASGLYKHFLSKEEMFAALVEPAYEGLKQAFLDIAERDIREVDGSFSGSEWEESDDSLWVIRYIYDHYQAFKLLVCRSQGTRFEDYEHELATLSERSTKRYMKELKKNGIGVKKIPAEELHILVTMNVHAVFLTVKHDLTRKEAIRYAKHLDEYNIAGWEKIFLA
ncbi:MAG: TetR/AcrR family transcriptional regulator [Lachnospiraceae bacterium]|nr:TetR/AcrR family transcriptional regulator [Lachnospiraceae bacterium]